jgi:hypothetical protein
VCSGRLDARLAAPLPQQMGIQRLLLKCALLLQPLAST